MTEKAPGGFVFGANLPWFDYGLDFGGNRWRPAGGIGRPEAHERVSRELAALADTGVQALRWFLFCDGRAGICFDQRGRPSGIDEFVLRDIDAALELAGRERVRVMFVLMDFHWCRAARIVDGVQVGGRAGTLEDRDARATLLDLVLRPVVERYAAEDSILAWDVFNEPEWVKTRGLKNFLSDAILMIRASSTRPVTIGSAGARWRRWYRHLDVDYAQVHWYDASGGQPALETPVAALGFERPVWLGEFPTRGSRLGWEEILETARAAGYAGAFYWSALSNDECSDPTRRPVCKAG
jgi:hypothetical protein